MTPKNFVAEPDFSLAKFSELNLQRCDGPEYFNVPEMPDLYWASALTEEAGEINGAMRKLQRGFNTREQRKFVTKHYKNQTVPPFNVQYVKWVLTRQKDVAEEAADLFIQLNLFCQKLDIDLWAAVQAKFNQVSEEMNFPHKL